jgi:hypothetical protein|tara:strand:- start:56 stop:445 length:390 start_codon:yes stop_codon:yes gene_type:complete
MKKLVIFFGFILFSFTTFSQVTDDSTTISNTELNEVFKAIDTLVKQDSLKTVLINDLTNQINLYHTLTIQDSLLLGYKNKQMAILNETIVLYDKRLKKVDKWYNKAWVGIIEGMALTTLSSWVIKNVVD